MSRKLIPPNTTIETSDAGVLAICDCEEQRPKDRLIAHGASHYVNGDGEEVPIDPIDSERVYITRDGMSTSQYATGSSGVAEWDAQAAENDDEPFCEGCGNYVRGWLHTADE